ncbi:MAG: ATP/GTP-binding protein [Candidatus Wukongarchaeota archaeon]|nr:ATP/GTP-binding protein [Candidatus Wukongarchaeota archaeon]
MVVFFCLAGSDKSMLTGMFGEWLRHGGYSVCIINIDKRVEILPYEPWIDVRNHFTPRFPF